MTRLERARQAQEAAAQKLAESRRQVAAEEAKEREQARKALSKRCYRVGAMAEQSGLLALDDETLAQVFALLTPLVQTPDPVRVLEGLFANALMLTVAGAEDDEDDEETGGFLS